MSDGKSCFVIAPIGDMDSDTRTRSDQVLNHIIKPVADDYGYDVERADEISEPGEITHQVIERTVNADLVVADLTEHNPNVFYELALRHAISEPIIQLIREGEKIPFDIAGFRTIKYDHRDLDKAAETKDELGSQIESIESTDDITNPISSAMDIQALQASGNPLEQRTAEILSVLKDLRKDMDGLSSRSLPDPLAPRIKELGKEAAEQADDALISIHTAQSADDAGEVDDELEIAEVEVEDLRMTIDDIVEEADKSMPSTRWLTLQKSLFDV